MGPLPSLALVGSLLANVALTAPTASEKQASNVKQIRQDSTLTPTVAYAPSGQISLNPFSTCNDEKADVLQQYMYDATDTHNHLQAFMNDHPGESNFVFDFATPQGVGQSFGSCSVTQPCERPNCDNLQDPNASLSAAGYNGLVSIANFSKWMAAMYSSFLASQSRFATLQTALQRDFYPSNPPGTLALREFIDAIQTIISTVQQLLTIPEAKAVTAFGTGVLTSIKDTISTQTDQLKNLAEIEVAVDNFVNSSLAGIVTANDEMISNGIHNGQQLLDLFEGGVFLDYRNVPVLNTDTSKPRVSTTDANNAFFSMIIGQLANYSWKKQNTFIMSYPMTEDEFNSKSVSAGSNDARLKFYYNGRGHYYQSMATVDDGLLPSNPKNIDPPGWGALGQYGIDSHDPIKSSVDAYDQGGFDFHADDVANTILDAAPGSIPLPGTSVAGIFSLPICAMDNNTPDIPDLDTFIGILDGPDTDFGQNAKGQVPSFCFCMGITDKNGKSFGDAGDWAKWDQYCTQDTPDLIPTGP